MSDESKKQGPETSGESEDPEAAADAGAVEQTLVGSAAPPVIPSGDTDEAQASPAPDLESLGQTMAGAGGPPPVPAAPSPEATEEPPVLDQTLAGGPGGAPPSIPSGAAPGTPTPPAQPTAKSPPGLVNADDALANLTLSSELEMTIAGPVPGRPTTSAPSLSTPSVVRPVRFERVEPADRAAVTPLDPSKQSYLLGRSRDCDVPLFTLSASRQHARMQRAGDTWTLEPIGDRRVSVDGKLITEATPLSHGSRIRLGEDELIFDDGSGPLPGSTMGQAAADVAKPQGVPSTRARSGRLVLLGLVVAVVTALVVAGVLMSRVQGSGADEQQVQQQVPADVAAVSAAADGLASAPTEAPPEPVLEVAREPDVVEPMEMASQGDEAMPEPVADVPGMPDELEPVAEVLEVIEEEPEPVEELELVELPAETAPPAVDDLLARAEELQRQYKLMTPADENAYDYLMRVLELDPGNARAEAGLRRMQQSYIGFARREFGNRKLSAAETYLSRAERVGRSGSTRALRAEVKALRRELAIERTIPARDPAPVAPLEPVRVAGDGDADPASAEASEEQEGRGFLFGLFD